MKRYKNQISKGPLAKYLTIGPLVGLVLMLVAAQTPVAHAQETTTVRGVVKNAQDGQPLPGTNVILVGTGKGTTTDAEGKFELKEVPSNGSLAFSFVGYLAQQVEVTRQNQTLNVAMKREQLPLEKVVVVGYGPVKSADPADGNQTKPAEGKNGFTVVEQMPEFPGGIQEMYKYLARSVRYPSDAARDNAEGQVRITFTVSDKGLIRNPKITQSVGEGIDEEALRVVLNMPSWTPAKQNGRAVPMEYMLPIEFMLDKGDLKEDKKKRQGYNKVYGAESPKFTSYRMPDFKFEDAVDFGISSPGPSASIAPTVTMPASNYSKRRYFFNVPKGVEMSPDTLKKTRFFNYHNPYKPKN